MPFCSFSEGAVMFDMTPIENMFLLEYLPGAPGDALRVYLYMRMLCLHPELGEGIRDVARALSMEEDDVMEALSYWEQRGLVEKLADRPPAYALRMLHSDSFHARQLQQADKYRELRILVGRLFGEDEYVHEKQFHLAVDWMEILKFSEKAVLRLLEFEMQQPGGKKPPSVFKRADRRAAEWADRGIRTVEDIEAAIAYEGSVYNMASLVIRQFNMGRKPTVPELKMVRGWIEDYGVTEEDVLEGCEKSINARSPSFGYIDSILRRRKGEERDENFEQVKKLNDELGMIGAKPSPDQMASYRGWRKDGFDPETILLAAVQCAKKGRRNFAGVSWMLENWGKAGVFTHDQARSYLAERQKVKAEAAQVLRKAGLKGEPGQISLDYYEGWKKRFSTELISCAADFAGGRKSYLDYMDKLLEGWEKKKITEPQAAREDYQREGGAPKSAARNYQQHEYTEEDFKDIFYDPAKDYGEGGEQQ